MDKAPPTTLRPADHGLVHGYIGDGKGKTTAAVGVAVRAVGYNWKVLYLQFMKSPTWPSGERESLQKLGVDVRVMGEGFYKILNDHKDPTEHRLAAEAALTEGRAALMSGTYQLVIMDELGSAVDEGLLSRDLVESLFRDRAEDPQAKHVHLIWTGHSSVDWMITYADLVTNMTMVKHPYYAGIIATKGLDY